MDIRTIINKIKKEPFTREDIYNVFQNSDTTFYRGYNIRTIIDFLLLNNSIIRVGRNRYIKKQDNANNYGYYVAPSKEVRRIIEDINSKYPNLSYVVWETNYLNEFLNHLIAKNYIIINVEKDGCEYVYSLLKDNYSNILLKPTDKEINYYSRNNEIIIDKLVSEFPKNVEDQHLISIEKIIVDLFAEKMLITILPKGDYSDMLERMFDKYIINQNSLFRYARRRNKEMEIVDFIKRKTRIKLNFEFNKKEE